MLSEEEKEGCFELLDLLWRDDLMSLCNTVTGGLVKPETMQEAVKAIVRYSSSAEQLLGRRKLKLDILFQYLHCSNVTGISTQTSKSELMALVLQLWQKKVAQKQSYRQISERPRWTTNFPPITPSAFKMPTAPKHEYSNLKQARSQPTVVVNSTTIINQKIKNITVQTPVESSGQVLAKEFIQWFYPLLNSLKDSGASDWGPQHFWPDACLSFYVINEAGFQMLEEKFEGAHATQEKLASLITQECVTWNPNTTSEGYRGAVSHGLAKVAVCGTIHRSSRFDHAQNLVGIFEQCFGLLKDISGGNRWKIKLCELKTKITGNAVEAAQITLSEDIKRAMHIDISYS